MNGAQRGSALVEFAIGSMVMLMLCFGVMEFGRALYVYHGVENVARQASRWAAVRGADCIDASCPATQQTIAAFVRSELPLVDPSTISVTPAWSNTSTCTSTPANGPGCIVSVTVSVPFNFDLPAVGNALTFTSSSQMVISE